MDRPGVRRVPEGSGEQGKMEKTGCKIICGAPTTLAVKGLMMMMKKGRTFELWLLDRSVFDSGVRSRTLRGEGEGGTGKNLTLTDSRRHLPLRPVWSKILYLVRCRTEDFSRGRAAGYVPYIRQAVSQQNGDTFKARRWCMQWYRQLKRAANTDVPRSHFFGSKRIMQGKKSWFMKYGMTWSHII